MEKIKEMIKEVNEAHDRVCNLSSLVSKEDMRKSILQLSEIFSDFLTTFNNKKTMKLWVVGRINQPEELEDHRGNTWDLIGVCSSEEIAAEACKDKNYFIGPIELNQILPKEYIEWEGYYHPKEGKQC